MSAPMGYIEDTDMKQSTHLSLGSMKFNGRDNRKLYNYVVRVIIAVCIMQESWGCLEGLLGKAGLEWSPKG